MSDLLHILGHPDLPLRISEHPEDSQLFNCWNFCKLAEFLGIDYIYYGVTGSLLPPGSHGTFAALGNGLPRRRWGYGNPRHRQYTRQLDRALTENLSQHAARQWLASIYGIAQCDIREYGLPVIEPMVGYTGCWAQYRVFPSNAHRCCTYATRPETDLNRRFCDTVIPHFIDPAEYRFSARRGTYLLYLGRDAADKGVHIAEQCAERCGMELRCVHRGLTGSAKARMLAGARAVLMPTLYPEPFGYVAAEAMMSGTPVITSAWGAFPELIHHGVTGWCCNSLEEFCAAVEKAQALDRRAIRREALRRFSLKAVAPLYSQYLAHVWEMHNTPENTKL